VKCDVVPNEESLQNANLTRRSSIAILVVLAITVGVGAGLLTVVFHWLIDNFHVLLFGLGDGLLRFMGKYYIILIPAIGGLLVGPLIHFLAREAKGCGVPEVMEAVALREGVIRPRVMVVKTLAAAFYIGSGGSVGSEGPVVQLGAAVGSVVGQILKVPGEICKVLVGCGAAAGISATFNAPLAGVLFALELILREFSTGTFSLIVISSVLASVTSQVFLGSQPAFAVPPYSIVHSGELVLYALLGAAAALVATVFSRVLYRTGDIWEEIDFMPPYIKPAIGGLMVGALGVFFPQILGMGFDSIRAALHNQMLPGLLIALVALKIMATALSVGSGGSGGVFAPSLYVGAMLGGAFGSLVHALYPTATGASGAYALVGMGALFAGVTQAPVTAIVMLFELTRDYQIILPLMISCVISAIVAGCLSDETIYTTKLARRGIHLQTKSGTGLLHSSPTP
jgi:CIC family chloride channel protein